MFRKEVVENLVPELVEVFPKTKVRNIIETLSRMGIGDSKRNILYQTCHLIKLGRRWYVCHFKEIFGLEDREINFVEGDLMRRNKIVEYMKEWGLIDIPKNTNMWNSYDVDIHEDDNVSVYVLKRDEKEKYNIERSVDIVRVNEMTKKYNENSKKEAI